MYTVDGTNTFSKRWLQTLLGLGLIITLLSGCKGITEVDEAKTVRRENQQFAGTGQALVYESNPFILAGSTNFTSFDFKDGLTVGNITTNNLLDTTCTFDQNLTSSFTQSDTTADSCFKIFNDPSNATQALQQTNQSWNFTYRSDEFYQVNLFYHLNKIQDRFFESLSFAHKHVHFDGNLTIPPATKHNMIDTNTYWLTSNGINVPIKAYSKCEATATNRINATFSPSDNSMCFDYHPDVPNFRVVQDPSVIYHEFGHAIVKMMMNQRNVTSGTDPNTFDPYYSYFTYSSSLGEIGYSEAEALNEGIADYFAYYMTQRKRIGEWGLGGIVGAAIGTNRITSYRPMNENDSEHTIDISETSGERLSYPQFLHYDNISSSVNTQDPQNVEDSHNAGMIISHYLVSLTQEFKDQCSFSSSDTDTIHETATNYTVLLLNETLAEIGDLTAKGSDILSQYANLDATKEDIYFTNLNEENSFLWTQSVNPPNFRRFFRIFGKNILHYISADLCPEFTLDESEMLLDDYGLLLFKSYEDRGNGLDAETFNASIYFNFNAYSVFFGRNFAPLILNTEVNEDNRRYSILVSKDFLELDDEVSAFLFDGQSSISGILSTLTFEGKNVTTTEGIAGVEYNNANIKISPGEVVGLSLNLKNSSNSIMGGVQLLANDWDHMKLEVPDDPLYSDGDSTNDPPYNYTNRDLNVLALSAGTISGYKASHSPCIYDDFPKESEGGVTDTTSTTEGSCSFVSKNNYDYDFTDVVGGITYPKYEQDAPQPICIVEFLDDNETKWVSQDMARSSMGIEDKDCLNNPSMSGDSFNPNECLVRVLPGATEIIFGKVNPDSTWVETMKEDTDQDVTFFNKNIVLMEVNKWIPPGTKFNCRFRTRFTNCIDCFNDNNSGDDYADFQYGGHAPYKIINYQFTVTD